MEGQLLLDCYFHQRLLYVSFTVQVSGSLIRKLTAWVRAKYRAIPDLPSKHPVSMEKRR